MFNSTYYEIYALITLEKYIGDFDNKFKKSESPDWIYNDEGIEVSRAFSEYESEFFSLFSKRKGLSKKEIGEKKLGDSKGFWWFFEDKLTAGCPGGLIDVSSYIELCKIIFKNKLEKLNQHYKTKKNSLFLFASGFVDNGHAESFLRYATELQLDYVKKYNFVYILDGDVFYILDLSKEKISKKIISLNDLVYIKKLSITYNKHKAKSTQFNIKSLIELL